MVCVWIWVLNGVELFSEFWGDRLMYNFVWIMIVWLNWSVSLKDCEIVIVFFVLRNFFFWCSDFVEDLLLLVLNGMKDYCRLFLDIYWDWVFVLN